MAKTVGDRLREARIELQRAKGEKPNQAAYARRIGIQPASLSDIESGESSAPAAATLLKIRDSGVSVDYVMRGKGPKLTVIDKIEHQINQSTLISMMGDLDSDEQQVLIDMAKAFIRKKPKPSEQDPFKRDPPKKSD